MGADSQSLPGSLPLSTGAHACLPGAAVLCLHGAIAARDADKPATRCRTSKKGTFSYVYAEYSGPRRKDPSPMQLPF